jgi:hypothetical protein
VDVHSAGVEGIEVDKRWSPTSPHADALRLATMDFALF